jgi:hypothetical protein
MKGGIGKFNNSPFSSPYVGLKFSLLVPSASYASFLNLPSSSVSQLVPSVISLSFITLLVIISLS